MNGQPPLLFVSAVEAWPALHGTGRRVEGLTEQLAASFDLTVLVSCHPGTPADTAPSNMRVVRVDRSASKLVSLLWALVSLVRRRPIAVGFYRRPKVRRVLRRLVRDTGPVAVIAQGIGGVGLCDGIVPADQIIYDTSDALHESFRSLARSIRGPGRVQWLIDAPVLEHFFRRELPRFAAVVAVSERDAASFRDLAPAANVIVVPNAGRPRPAPRPDPGSGNVLFVGDLNYPPNRDGLVWLLDDVMPLLPDVSTVRAIGLGTPPRHHRLDHVGFVDDLETEWDKALITVAPTFSGGGTHVKVVEALGAGVPVISTSFGARGLGLEPGRDYLQADSAEDFAAAIRHALQDVGKRRDLSEAGWRAAAARFSWARVVEPLATAIAARRDDGQSSAKP